VKKLLVLVVLVAGCGFGASRGVDYYNYEVNTPVSNHSEPVNFTVQSGESASQIGADLQDKRLIRSQDFFNLYLKLSGTRGDLQAGDFVLNRNLSIPQIVDALQHGRLNQAVVQVPEGIPAKFIAQALEQHGFAKAQDYLDAEKDPAWTGQYDFLAGKPKDRDLEGYLYPDTYSLNKGAGVRDLIKAQLDQLGKVFTPEMRQAIGQPTSGRPAETMDQILILASMVDREVNKAEERPRVCGLYYNRLSIGMKLEVDATVLYAEGRLKGDITQDDLNINSPYNTRKFAGLPPGPIGNPTASAIKGCVNPEKNNFLFYFTDKNGVTHFEATFEQFQADMAKYGVSGG
jgi:UPF0755 protein